MPRIISAIMAVQAVAANTKPMLTTPVAASTTAMTSIGMQQGDHHPAMAAVAAGLRLLLGGVGVVLGCHHGLRSDGGR